MSFSNQNWPNLDESYADEFGPISKAVYEAARLLWPRACSDARAKLGDEAAGQRLLFKAAAAVTRQDLSQIKDIEAYLWVSFAHLMLAELQHRQRDHSADEEVEDLPSQVADEFDEAILIDEIVRRMTPEMRSLFRLRTLGYSYEELAHPFGQSANVLRSKLAKEFQRIKRELAKT